MKKSLLIISALFLVSFGANAQITLTAADIASPTRVIRQAHDTLPTVSAGSAGVSQTWNMTALNTSFHDTMDFIGLSWTPHASSFPTANLGIDFLGQSTYGYLNSTASSLILEGNSILHDFGGGPSNIIQKNTAPGEILANFPAVYGSSFNNNFTNNTTFFYGVAVAALGGTVVDSVRQKAMIQKTVNIDAWGNITTPLGTFASLRFKTIKFETDSTWLYVFGSWTFAQTVTDTTKDYGWWANGIGYTLVDATVNYYTDAVKKVDWLQALPTAGINEVSNTGVNVYPNPAQDQITFVIGSAKAISIQVFDVAGRRVNTYPVSSYNPTINISNLSNGSYLYAIIGKDNTVMNRGKFTVAK